MSTSADRAHLRRCRQRGAAAVELGISLIVLMPLIFGMIDYGYFFYVSITASDAARAAARATANTPTTTCDAPSVALANIAGKAVATTYMNQTGLGSPTNLTFSATCAVVAGPPALGPVWTVTVKVDFPPLIGFIRSLMKPSTHTGWVVFTETVAMPGR
jgi:Flp pilus assembly protein TadG